jgi:hypothetical protein
MFTDLVVIVPLIAALSQDSLSSIPGYSSSDGCLQAPTERSVGPYRLKLSSGAILGPIQQQVPLLPEAVLRYWVIANVQSLANPNQSSSSHQMVMEELPLVNGGMGSKAEYLPVHCSVMKSYLPKHLSLTARDVLTLLPGEVHGSCKFRIDNPTVGSQIVRSTALFCEESAGLMVNLMTMQPLACDSQNTVHQMGVSSFECLPRPAGGR